MTKTSPRKTKPPKPDGKTPGMHIEMWPVDKPVDYPKNARKWSPAAVEKVAASLREFGFRQPIVVDKDAVIVIGHLRRAAARSAGFTVVPVHVADNLSPAKVRALRLMDNRSHDEAQWDLDVLADEMAELSKLDLDLTLTGFTDPLEYGSIAGVEFKEFDESAAADVKYHQCPECSHRWPA